MEKLNIYNLIILDESGSMESIKKQTIAGFNKLIYTIKKAQDDFKEQNHRVTFVTFNSDGVKFRIFNNSISEINKITEKMYNPSSMTPLYDAIGESILKLKEVVDDDHSVVIATILTDGAENSSKEFTQNNISSLIAELKEKNWSFSYIGANQDVERVSKGLSITNNITFSATESGVLGTFNNLSNIFGDMFSGLNHRVNNSNSFFDEIFQKGKDKKTEKDKKNV